MTGLQLNFTGRQLTDKELEILGFLPSDDGTIEWSIIGHPNYFQVENINDPNAQVLNSKTYFEDLVSRFTSADSFPRIIRAQVESEYVPLYGLDANGRASLPKDTVSGEGLALALEVLARMFYYNLCVRLQQEMSLILESKTTDDTQMARVGSLLKRYARLQRDQRELAKDSEELEQFVLEAIIRRSVGARSNVVVEGSQPREASRDLENPTLPVSDRDEPTGRNREEPTGRDREEPTERVRREPIVWSTGSDPEEWPGEREASGRTQNEYFRSQRRERLARKLGMRNRFSAAVLGGLSLFVPMLIMAIKPSQVKTLCTSSVAVLLFSLGLACMSSARTETLLATTATYAAVMVVFVGVNSNN